MWLRATGWPKLAVAALWLAATHDMIAALDWKSCTFVPSSCTPMSFIPHCLAHHRCPTLPPSHSRRSSLLFAMSFTSGLGTRRVLCRGWFLAMDDLCRWPRLRARNILQEQVDQHRSWKLFPLVCIGHTVPTVADVAPPSPHVPQPCGERLLAHVGW